MLSQFLDQPITFLDVFIILTVLCIILLIDDTIEHNELIRNYKALIEQNQQDIRRLERVVGRMVAPNGNGT